METRPVTDNPENCWTRNQNQTSNQNRTINKTSKLLVTTSFSFFILSLSCCNVLFIYFLTIFAASNLLVHPATWYFCAPATKPTTPIRQTGTKLVPELLVCCWLLVVGSWFRSTASCPSARVNHRVILWEHYGSTRIAILLTYSNVTLWILVWH